MSRDEETPEQCALFLEGKGEVVGNLIAARLSGRGIEFFTYGEYFESEPLIIIEYPEMQILKQIWMDGVSFRTLSMEGANLEEKLIAHRDTMIYVVRNTSNTRLDIRCRGPLKSSAGFSPNLERISELAGSNFTSLRGGILGSYSNRGPFILMKASHKTSVTSLSRTGSSFYSEASLAPREEFVFAVAGHHAEIEECEKRADEALSSPESVAASKRREVREALEVALDRYPVKREHELMAKYLWYVILSNRAQVNNHPILIHPFVMPSKFGLRHQWLWDSAFHAIVLSKIDPEMAKGEIANLFNAQKEDGRIPHEIFLSKEFCKLFWNVDDYAPWTTQPPVLALALEKIIEKGVDEQFIRQAFNSLDRYDRWFRNERDADGDQLMSYVDYLESGWDDSVRWDEPRRKFDAKPEEYRVYYSQIRMAPVEAVDLTCFIYLQRIFLSKTAERLGLAEDSEKYQRLAAATAKGVRELMWDEETGFYYDVYEKDHGLIKVKTPAAFLTLYAGIATKQQAERLVRHLFNPEEFWTTFPLPTVSADHPNYDPAGYWRGRSWINIAWFTYHGLRRYGYEREASLLSERIVELMAGGPSCSENYNSRTGEPLGATDFGWSTLALDFISA